MNQSICPVATAPGSDFIAAIYLFRGDRYVVFAVIQPQAIGGFRYHQRPRPLEICVFTGGHAQGLVAGQIQNLHFAILAETKTVSTDG